MNVTKAKDIKAARRRKMLDRQEARMALAWAGTGRRHRTCVACGKPFLPYDHARRMFGCACCAEAWGRARDDGGLDRRIGRGAKVVRWADGAAGEVAAVHDAAHATARFGDGTVEVGLADVERLAGLAVEHLGSCPGHGPRAGRKQEESDGRGADAGRGAADEPE